MRRYLPLVCVVALAVTLPACDDGGGDGESSGSQTGDGDGDGDGDGGGDGDGDGGPNTVDCNNVPSGTVCIPEGDFTMGSDELSQFSQPERTVTLSAFYVDISEVTVEEYAACVNDGGACPPPEQQMDCNAFSFTDDPDEYGSYPMNCVTWAAADAYCTWAGGALPTEAEWERVARGTDGRTYPWGEESPSCNVVIWGGDPGKGPACGIGASVDTLSPDRSSLPNASGAYDMGGNLAEWCRDWFEIYDADDTTNPTGPSGPSPEYGEKKIVRGGSYVSNVPKQLRATERDSRTPSSGANTVGFRCVYYQAP